MNATVIAAVVSVIGSVVVAVAALWANVRSTNKTTEVSRDAVAAATRAVELTEQGPGD